MLSLLDRALQDSRLLFIRPRANLSPLMIEGSQAGGQLTLTTDVENFPGFPEGIMGPKLIQDMRAQAERFGTMFQTADVTNVDLSRRPFTLTINDEENDSRSIADYFYRRFGKSLGTGLGKSTPRPRGVDVCHL